MPQEGRFYGSYRQEPSVEEVIAWLNRRNWAMQKHICVAIQALKKQVPMKPEGYYFCPVCKMDLGHFQNEESDETLFYCGNCGQRLDWGEC